MKRSPTLARIVVLPALPRALGFEGVWLYVLGPVPVSVQSETPSSRCFGEFFGLAAMFDLGESRYANEVERAKCEDKFPP